MRGEQHHRARLTESQVKEMRSMHYDKGLCIRCVAVLHDVPYPTAWDAISFNTWRHVQ